MTAPVPAALLDTLDFLVALNEAAAPPAAARQRLRPVQARHPGLTIDLLWQEEAYDGSVHYDALIRRDGAGTVSLSVSPDRALPWPLRGIHRWKEHDLARVNHRVLEVGDAIRLLDFVWDEVRLTDRLLNACVIREELDRDPITISDAELQRAMDAFRRARGLGTIDETRRWLDERGLTHGGLEELVLERVMIGALRDRITAGQVDTYLTAHRGDFDVALIAQFETADEAGARRILERIRTGELGFLEAAQQSVLEALASAPSCPLFASIRRGEATDARGRAVFAARLADVLDPIRVEKGFAIVKVLAIEPARLDEKTRSAIQGRLFDEWLARRRRAATVEWYWGMARETRDPGAAAPAGA